MYAQYDPAAVSSQDDQQQVSGDLYQASGGDATARGSTDAAASAAPAPGPAPGDESNPLLAAVSASGAANPFSESLNNLRQAWQDAGDTETDASLGRRTDGDLAGTLTDTGRVIPGLSSILPTGADVKKMVDDAEGVHPWDPINPSTGGGIGAELGGLGGALVGGPFAGPVTKAAGATLGATWGRMMEHPFGDVF